MATLELEIGKSLLQVFASLAGKYIEKAREYREHDVRACENYLEAARVAITGLEEEYDQILVQAKNCDLGQHDQVRTLQTRIDTYLTVDTLRPKLKDAVTGLLRTTLVSGHAKLPRIWCGGPGRSRGLSPDSAAGRGDGSRRRA